MGFVKLQFYGYMLPLKTEIGECQDSLDRL